MPVVKGLKWHSHYVLRVWGLQPWPMDACWICPVTQMGFCLGRREMQADELWGDQLIRQPAPHGREEMEQIKKQWVRDPEWHTVTPTDTEFGWGKVKTPISCRNPKPQEKTKLVKEDLENFPKFGKVRGYTSSASAKNELLHKQKWPGRKWR